jgi:hypothetical protein
VDHVLPKTSPGRAPSQCSAVTLLLTVRNSLGGILYPFSQVQCIEPIYNSDIHNILGMGHLRAPPPTHTTIDPCRTPQPQDWEEWQKATRCPASPKKRKADQANIIRISEDGLVQLVEDTMTRILRDFVALKPTISSIAKWKETHPK